MLNWLKEDLGEKLESELTAERIIDDLLEDLDPYRTKSSRFTASHFYEITGREEEFAAAIEKTRNSILADQSGA